MSPYRKFRLRTSLVTLAFLALSPVAQAIEWPSREFPTLQSAVDATPPGGTLEIRQGVFYLSEPIFVIGRQILIKGAGSGRNREQRVTYLVGPSPRPVVDEQGNLVLRADAVVGLWNFIAANIVIQDMNLTGFDAGIVSKADAEGNSGPTTVKDLVISNTGRGILSLSSSDLIVEDCTITSTLWNAISFGPGFLSNPAVLPNLTANTLELIDPGNAGIYFEHTIAYIDDATVLGAQAGGILGLASSSFILNSVLLGNREAGILLVGGFSEIDNNIIQGTLAGDGGLLGDGISLWASDANQQPMQAFLFDNLIQSSERAGVSVFGAAIDMGNNHIFCADFDVIREPYAGFMDVVNDLGGNECGCGALEVCAATGSQPTPPEPVGGLE